MKEPHIFLPACFLYKETYEYGSDNLTYDLSITLTPQTFSGFDDLISKAHELKKRMIDHKREKKGKVATNKIESAMVGTKKQPTKIVTKKPTKTTQATSSGQGAPPRRPSMRER